MTAFSENFLNHFPSTRVAHSIPVSLVKYHGKEWSIEEKSVISAEVNSAGITHQLVANYLGTSTNRIEKLMRGIRTGKRQSETGGRANKLDEEGTSNEKVAKAARRQERESQSNR